MGISVPRGVVAVNVVLLGLLIAMPARASTVVRGSSIVRALREDRRVVLDGAVVVGRVDLQDLGTVSHPFKCRRCNFRGGIVAPDVTFRRSVDLSFSIVDGPIDFSGAEFAAPFVCADVLFNSSVDASDAVFRDDATFKGAQFARVRRLGAADFHSARFASRATFSQAIFHANAAFASATFEREATFGGARFDGEADFGQATFGRGGFREIVSLAPSGANFADATFRGVADFSGSVLAGGGATFDGTEFLDRASFVRTAFWTSRPHPAASFDTVDAAADVDLSSAGFAFVGRRGHRSLASQPIASFENLVAQGLVSLRGASFPAERPIVMEGLSAHGMVLDVDEVANVQRDKEQVLVLIQRAAKERDDLGMANDAEYRLHMLRSHRYSTVVRVADIVFYRWLAGYFVRPQYPLVALVVLVLCLSTVRAVVRGRERRKDTRRAFIQTAALAPHPPPRTPVRKWFRYGLVVYIGALLDTFSLIGPRRVDVGGSDSRFLRLGEATAYRLLLVCVIIGLANSNPTLRQFVDTFT
jgi:uncharacterized protein YjbI with pentapeptide repeats